MMMPISLTRSLGRTATVAVLLAASASGVAAQEADERPGECICPDEIRERVTRFMTTDRRARLGVGLGPDTTIDGRGGVALADVPEGTPAHRAGLRAGDVVIAVDGTELGAEATAALLRRMEDVEPGDTVRVTYRRGGSENTAAVIAEAGATLRFFGDGSAARPWPPMAPDAPRLRRAHPGRVEMAAPRILARVLRRDGLELAAVNPELGRYFGTDQGVLVVEVEEESRLNLHPGDVILEIGDREVRDPAHARSILASYLPEEEIRFRVVREERTIEVTGRMTEHAGPRERRGG